MDRKLSLLDEEPTQKRLRPAFDATSVLLTFSQLLPTFSINYFSQRSLTILLLYCGAAIIAHVRLVLHILCTRIHNPRRGCVAAHHDVANMSFKQDSVHYFITVTTMTSFHAGGHRCMRNRCRILRRNFRLHMYVCQLIELESVITLSCMPS